MYPNNGEEQSFLGSEIDTPESFYDTATEYAGAAYDAVSDVAGHLLDTDHDGAVLDDIYKYQTTGAGIILGAALGIEGGPEGVVAGAEEGYAASAEFSSMAEEFGDSVSDALGTRGELPYGSDGCTDPYYKDGL
jgi:hypothetical protein